MRTQVKKEPSRPSCCGNRRIQQKARTEEYATSETGNGQLSSGKKYKSKCPQLARVETDGGIFSSVMGSANSDTVLW
jgi:hypothetical protein